MARQGRPTDVDKHVGLRIRDRRIMLGLTQEQFAELIGVTYQQAHKYEKGINRIAASRLYRVAKALGVELNYLFDGVEDDVKPRLASRGALEMSQLFVRLPKQWQTAMLVVARTAVKFEYD